jgi:hypothetical protein
MAISKALSLPRPLSLPKPAPTSQASAPKPAKPASGGVAGQAAAPHEPATKPQGQLSRPSVDSFNPNAKPVNLPGAVGGGINPNTKPKPQGAPTVGINPNTPTGGIIPVGDWANQGLGKLEVTGPTIGGRNPHATGDINTHGKPSQPEPWTTYSEALEQNRDVFPNKGAYDLGAAFDRAFDQGVILDATTGGAELRPGGGWGDLIEANKDSIPPGWANNE